MTFLYPEFLWAISLIAIPIIIHLFNFRRYKKIYYSDISLLKSIKTETKNRSQLKHILILISRILAICSLVLAFCFPFKPYNNQYINNEKITGIYLDNSLSMSNKNQNDRLLDLAKQQALDLVEQYSSATRFLFTTNDSSISFYMFYTIISIQLFFLLEIAPRNILNWFYWFGFSL